MKRYKIFGLLAAAMVAAASWSCDDDGELAPLAKSDISAADVTYNSLTFNWGKVANARQYSYQLVETATENIITTGITKDTSASFTGLTHDTEYTLTVLAYAAMESCYTTSDPIVLTARTNDLVTLPSPVLSWSREVNTIIATWNAVDGSRDYVYTLTDADGNSLASGSTYDTYVSFADMKTGTYTLSVTAEYANDGYRDSQPATLVIDFVRERQEIWRSSGIYSSVLLGTSWPAELVAYDDNTYVLESWYGADGYDFGFSLDETNASDMFKPDQSYSYDAATKAYTVPTGIASPSEVSVFAHDNLCAFAGNAGRGSVTLHVSDGTTTGNDTFSWGVTIQDFVGTWTCDFAAYDYSGDASYNEFFNGNVEITLGTEPNTLIVPMPSFWGYLSSNGVMVVDLDSMTFTMQPVSFSIGYLAGNASASAPLTGKISTSGITFDVIQAWYSGYSYLTDASYLKFTR